MNKSIRAIFLLFAALAFGTAAMAQDSTANWDNQLYLGNKVGFGSGRMKYSLEIQGRFRDNMQQMDNLFTEFVASYLWSSSIEIVPDLRFTVKPTKLELRPGFGILYKHLQAKKLQFVNQVKYQFDWASAGENGHAFREVIFLNKKANDKVIVTLVAGFIYRWWPSWNGFQYVRMGPGLTYKFNSDAALNFSYFVGVENRRGDWLWAGIPVIQFVVNIANTYKYTPAYYFSF